VVKATGFMSFFTDIGSEIISPTMPIFLTQLAVWGWRGAGRP
jgi:hypothetical protein